MLQIITVLITGIIALTAISGIIIITDSSIINYNITETKADEKLETDKDLSLNSGLQQNNQNLNKNAESNITQSNHIFTDSSILAAVKIKADYNQATLQNYIYSQTELQSRTNGIRAPTAQI